MGGKPVGYSQSVALGLPWHKSKWSERDSNPVPPGYKSGAQAN